MPKEVNEISKFFKKNNQPTEKKDIRKSYVQVFFSTTSTREVLKIKETFPNLRAKKIKNIQKIINGKGKPKPRISIMMKGPPRKQIIVPMSNENKTKFMKESSAHITNLNRALKTSNLKSWQTLYDQIKQI